MRTLAIKIFIVSVWLLFCSVKAGFCQKNKRQDLLFEIVKDGQPKSYIYSTFYSIDFDFLQVSDSVFDLFDGCSNFVTEYDFDLFFSEAISNILESEASVKNHPIFQESGWNNTEDEYLHLLSSFDLSRKTQKKTNTKHKIKASVYEFLVNRADHASLNTLGLDTTNQEYLKATKLVGLVNNSEISEEEKKRVSTYVFQCLLNHEVSITNELYQTFLQADTSSLHESMIKFGSIHDTNEKRAKNRWMTDRLEKIMSSGSTFTLLSPGSIVGSGGILQLLKERGYTIRKVVSKYDFSVVKKINENKVGSKLSRTQFCTPVYNICADFPVKPVKINDGPIFSEIYVSYDQRTNVNYTLSAFRVDDVADQKETFRNFKENLRNSKDFSGLQYTGDIEKGSIISNHFKARHLNGYCEGQILLGENVLVIFFATAPKLVSLYQAECAKLINTIKINEQNAIVQSSQENWINYSSTASGFTCRIPNVFTTKSDINDNSGNTLGAYREFEYQLPDNSCIFKINILTPVKNQSITDYIDIKEHIKRVYCNNETYNLSSTIDPISIGNLSAVGITATSDDYFDQYVAFIRGNTFWEIEARGNPARTKDAEYFINSFRPEKLKTASLSKTEVPFFKIVEPIFPDNTEPNFSHSTHGGFFLKLYPLPKL